MKSFDQLPDYKDLQCLWKQERIERPIPNLELTPDSGMERGAEVVGWWIARLEFWLSESGWLRAWLRFNLIVSIRTLSLRSFSFTPFNVSVYTSSFSMV